MSALFNHSFLHCCSALSSSSEESLDSLFQQPESENKVDFALALGDYNKLTKLIYYNNKKFNVFF